MRFIETGLEGAFVIDVDYVSDERGRFARTWDQAVWVEMGLDAEIVQTNLSVSHDRGTLRGLHFQAAPHAETKLVRCTAGSIFDVIVDLRPGSRTFLSWFGTELTVENRRSLHVPKGFAHGFLTLADGCEVCYQMSVPFEAGAARGYRWDDPAFGIRWPFSPTTISARDAKYPDFPAIPTQGGRRDL